MRVFVNIFALANTLEPAIFICLSQLNKKKPAEAGFFFQSKEVSLFRECLNS